MSGRRCRHEPKRRTPLRRTRGLPVKDRLHLLWHYRVEACGCGARRAAAKRDDWRGPCHEAADREAA
ncbi:MAG: hypothetical protein OXC31_19910 [Spirochaetaceae bacterium]|nr:hypothetical protein [Spirochaetaceae bacterium]